MFHPELGRWIQEDPIGFEAGDQNFYRYVANSPANLTDPTGLEPGSSGGPSPVTPNPISPQEPTGNLEVKYWYDQSPTRTLPESAGVAGQQPAALLREYVGLWLNVKDKKAGQVEKIGGREFQRVWAGFKYYDTYTVVGAQQAPKINMRVWEREDQGGLPLTKNTDWKDFPGLVIAPRTSYTLVRSYAVLVLGVCKDDKGQTLFLSKPLEQLNYSLSITFKAGDANANVTVKWNDSVGPTFDWPAFAKQRRFPLIDP